MSFISPNVSEGKKDKFVVTLVGLGISFFFLIIICLFITCIFYGCTLSFQNISTHGTATDLVDEHQTASPKTDANIPISLTPK